MSTFSLPRTAVVSPPPRHFLHTSVVFLLAMAAIFWTHPAQAQGGTLVNDGLNRGTLAAAGSDTWTFAANSGDSIILRLASTNSLAQFQVFGPVGEVVATAAPQGDTVASFSATNSGTYSVTVTFGPQGVGGAYILRFAHIPAAFTVPAGEQGGPLANGVDNPGTLSLGDLQMWTYTAQAGQGALLRLIATNFSAQATIYGPDGTFLFNSCCGIDGDTILGYFPATNSGVFTVVVEGAGSGQTGSYILRFADLSLPFTNSEPSLTNGINYGNLRLGSLDRWTFSVNSGDFVALRLVATNFSASPSLFGPDGRLINALCCAPGGDTLLASFTATNSGIYTVLVDSAIEGETGSYFFHFVDLSQPFPTPAATLTNGSNFGNLALGAIDRWTFNAAVGDTISLRMETTNFNAGPYLFGPDGQMLAAKCCANGGDTPILSMTVTSTGAYTLLVASALDGGDGAYTVELADFSQPFPTPAMVLTNGDNSGNLALGALDRWTFSANPGDFVALRLVATNFDATCSLFASDGELNNTLCCAVGGDAIVARFVATNSDDFTVLVNSTTDGGIGTYELRLANLSQPFATPAVTLSNGVDNAAFLSLGGLDRWSFTANAGDSIILRVVTTNFNAGPYLFGPDGRLLDTECCAASGDTLVASFTATNSGVFSLLVSSADDGGTGSYVVKWSDFSQPFPAPAVTLTNGADNLGLLSLGGLDRWSFTAHAGDNIIVRLLTTNFDAGATLYAANGTTVASTCCSSSGDTFVAILSITNSGVYTLAVSSFSDGGDGPYLIRFLNLSQSFGFPSTSLAGTNMTANLSLASLDRWQFTACAGDWLNPAFASTNFASYFALYSPSGILLAANNGSNLVYNVRATNSGTFTLLVTGNFDGASGFYTLIPNGLTDGIKLCPPDVTPSAYTLTGIGGPTNAEFVLHSASLLPEPDAQWTPIYTNRFGAAGVFIYTNLQFNPNSGPAYFRLFGP